jgi:glutamate dehydrogenase
LDSRKEIVEHGKQPSGRSASVAHNNATEASEAISAAAKILETDDPDLADYFSAFTKHAIPEDIVRFSNEELAALVRHVYASSRKRKPGKPFIEVFDLAEDGFRRSEVVLVAINDDMPFLFDSCAGVVRAQDVSIRAAFHPIIPRSVGKAGRTLLESTIVLALGRMPDGDRAKRLKESVGKVIEDVRIAVSDWRPMLDRFNETIDELSNSPPNIPEQQLEECIEFLEWLSDNHFTFLGARDYAFDTKTKERLEPDFKSGIGLLRDPETRVIRRGEDRSSLTPDVRDFLMTPSPLIITKSNTRSNVHRRVFMDYIGVKRFDSKGSLIGERRFVGLFTSGAYSQSPSEIPLLRLKVARALEDSGIPVNSHDGKALAHILHTYPREELIQVNHEELVTTALGILSLTQRTNVRVFLRFDRFDRFVSALVYLPRERFNTYVRQQIHGLLADALDGRMSNATPSLEHETLARIHYIIGRNMGPRPQVDVHSLEAKIREIIRTWADEFADLMRTSFHDGAATDVKERYEDAFPPAYRDTFSANDAIADIPYIEALLDGSAPGGTCFADVYELDDGDDNDKTRSLRLTLFALDEYVSLSEALPIFENLGLKVITEESFLLTPRGKDGQTRRVALMNFLTEPHGEGTDEEFPAIKERLEGAFHAVWLSKAESDGFNQLVVATQLNWRDVTILRGIAKYLRQAGLTYNQSYIESALDRNSVIALLLVDLFYALHEPAAYESPEAREDAADDLHSRIDAALENVPSADEDRIIRAVMSVIDATLRTNFFQRDRNGASKPVFSFKVESGRLDMLPNPRPHVEIFVYSPEVEGVHLRFGPIARGGIRWSDRAEDFRTEVMGLVKAQQVKNAVIVPVGAKGGFYPKRLPAGGTREEIQAAAIEAYKTFISALLDLTDNIAPDGSIVPPEDVLRYDGDDPYLVVAADKGTASFSDIANKIALSREYWLGDAFASGGSNGYDHKKMGITARGAWEAVKRHFRELGRDIQKQPFTCIGVGDMSGDVFGNAMLLSKKTKLIAAFDHRHIFFDPAPDPKTSWRERKRLFGLKRSNWDDYDKSLISKGGGVVPRSAKTIRLSPEMKTITGLSKNEAAPRDVINALLKAEADLLFFGGIGTFIKSANEGDADVGDRANDFVRVDGREVRASVIGEGANLGATQLGRIEYSRKGGPDRTGGRINTDAIDNSAGVDTSDHEVNLKILLNAPLRRGALSEKARDKLLRDLTDEIARLVLQDNYDQTMAISVARSLGQRDIEAAARFVRDLERSGKLERAVEFLPDEEGFRAYIEARTGLSRPDLAVLLSYAKLDLLSEVVKSPLPDDAYLETLLNEYFPTRIQGEFAEEIGAHRLRREIIATQLVNRMVNLAGPLYAFRMREISGAPAWQAARAFAIADGAFGATGLKGRIDALDLKVPTSVQYRMIAEIGDFLRRTGVWMIAHSEENEPLTDVIAAHGEGAKLLRECYSEMVTTFEAREIAERTERFTNLEVEKDLAQQIALLPLLSSVPEIVLLSHQSSVAFPTAAGAYFGVGEVVGLDRLRAHATGFEANEHWDRLALRHIANDLRAAQRILACSALSQAGTTSKESRSDGLGAAKAWAERHADVLRPVLAFIDEVDHGGVPTIGKITLASSQIQQLARESA